MHELKDFIL